MKNMKKVISFMLVLLMALSMSATVFADETETGETGTTGTTGTITINGVSKENTYTIYKLLDLESYDTATGAYSYKVNEAWKDFFATEGATKYFTVDEQGYATWIATEDDATVAAFAKLALAYAKDNDDIAYIDTETISKDYDKTTLVFSDLGLGYYLIDSTMGALCGLTTTNPNASINAKNAAPIIDKQVQEDLTGQWGDSNTADIGQTVKFRTTINVHAGAENYVLHDKMSAGLTFKEVSKVELVSGNSQTEVAAEGNYEVAKNEENEVLEDGCTFEVKFNKAFCDNLMNNDRIIVYYEAMVNRNAVIAGTGNPNEAWLEFGEEHYTTPDTTNTFTFGFDIIKTDSQNKLIDGAEFRIYDAETGGNEVAVVLMDDGVTYRRARADETGVSIVVTDGKVRVEGFDNGTYYLEETVTPSGYNKLTERQKFTIADANLDSIFNGEIYSTGSGVHVVNKSGTMLPETGGTGTVMFITIGMLVTLAAGVLLVTKRRMSMIDD